MQLYRVHQIVEREAIVLSPLLPFHKYTYLPLKINSSYNIDVSLFLFLKGLHILQGTVRNVTKLTLIGVLAEDSKIQCEGPAGLYSKEVILGNFTVSNLMFSNCRAESADELPCIVLLS